MLKVIEMWNSNPVECICKKPIQRGTAVICIIHTSKVWTHNVPLASNIKSEMQLNKMLNERAMSFRFTWITLKFVLFCTYVSKLVQGRLDYVRLIKSRLGSHWHIIKLLIQTLSILTYSLNEPNLVFLTLPNITKPFTRI